MENENPVAIQGPDGPTLLDMLTQPLSSHFGYTVTSFLAVYIYTCALMFM